MAFLEPVGPWTVNGRKPTPALPLREAIRRMNVRAYKRAERMLKNPPPEQQWFALEEIKTIPPGKYTNDLFNELMKQFDELLLAVNGNAQALLSVDLECSPKAYFDDYHHESHPEYEKGYKMPVPHKIGKDKYVPFHNIKRSR